MNDAAASERSIRRGDLELIERNWDCGVSSFFGEQQKYGFDPGEARTQAGCGGRDVP